jgi:hexosaminidase
MLLPTPRKKTPLGGTLVLPPDASALLLALSAHDSPREAPQPPWLSISIDAAHGPATGTRREAYRLSIEQHITIQAADPAGIRMGLRTLRQMIRASGGAAVPTCIIEDEPAFETRGVMLDVSRDRIPTMLEFRRIIQSLGELKFNHLQLYTEHTFAYPGHEIVWRGWSPLTPQEVRRLDEWCREEGIELAANQNCFGHMVPWLKHDAYQHLAETHGDWMFDIWPRSGPFSLCPTDPASMTFVEGLLDELLPCFSSPWVNIGCDETYDIAYGRSKAHVDSRGRAMVYMEFVNKIASAVRSRGKKAQFWGDIALSHPECVAQIPADVLSLAWGYEPNSPFEQWGRMLAGRPHWVCPGTSTWRTITGRTTERRGNIEAAAREGVRSGATGLLICDWGDSGHHQQWPVSLHALADGAQAAWNPEAPRSLSAQSLQLFDDPTGATSQWLDELGDADLALRETCGALSHPTRTRLLNQTAIFIDMFKQFDEQTSVGDRSLWYETLDRLEGLSQRLPPVRDALVHDELEHTIQYACFAAARGAMRRDQPGASQINGLRDRLAGLRRTHARLWLSRSREGGLAHSDSFFGQIDQTLAAATSGASQHGVTMFE